MAASGFTAIQLYRTATASAAPSAGNLADGELALNTLDEKLYFKNSAGVVKLLASMTSVAITGGTINGASVGATTPSTGAFTTLSANGNMSLTKVGSDASYTISSDQASGYSILDLKNVGASGKEWQIVVGGNSATVSPNSLGIFDVTGGSLRATFSSTGLSVSGGVTASAASYLDSTLTWRTTGTSKWTLANDFPSAGQFTVYDNSVGASRATFSSTGLAVTGAVSATTSNTVNDGTINLRSIVTGGVAYFGTISNHPLAIQTNNAEIARFDTSGNLGLGVTPSAWSQGKALQFGFGGSLWYDAASLGNTRIGNNYYFNSGFKYQNTGEASYYQQGAGSHYWFTAPSGTAGNAITFTQAMTLDASGNLGVGTASPQARLHAYLAGGAGMRLDSGSNGYSEFADVNGTLYLTADRGGLGSKNLIFRNNGTTEVGRFDASGYLKVADNLGYTRHELWQKTLGSYAVTIGAATSTPANAFGLNLAYPNCTPNGTGSEFLYCGDSAALRASIRSNGGVANYQANDVNLSDARLKTDFQPAKSYFDRWTDIDFITYLYKDQTDTERNLGVTAQQLETVFPELIDNSGFGEAPDGEAPYKAVYQTDFSYATGKALQEAIAKIKQLETYKSQAEIAIVDLLNRVAALEAK